MFCLGAGDSNSGDLFSAFSKVVYSADSFAMDWTQLVK